MKFHISLFAFICFLALGCQQIDESTMHVLVNPIDQKYPEAEYFSMRNWPDESFDKAAFLSAVKQVNSDDTKRSAGNWETQGPGNISGRISTIAIDDNKNIYLGYSKGGVYKSTDDGLSFEPLIDDQAFLAVSDIEIDPNDQNTIYIGTGDVDISLMFGIGNGVLKSTDGGETWDNIGLETESIISRVHVDTENSDLVYASAMGIPGEKNQNRGVYKSLNGGIDWEQVLFVNDSTGIQDMLVDPTNPDIVYATGWNRIRNNRRSVVSGPDARIYRTRNGGISWDTLTNDLPTGNFARVGLEMSGSDPNTIFVNYGTTQNLISLHKSQDGGDSWDTLTVVSENELLSDGNGSHGGFAWFFGQMRVNPINDDDIFILGQNLYRSLDGGQSWELVTGDMHVDFHDLVFDEDRIYVGNDGGAYRSVYFSNDWVDLDFNVTGLLYKVGYNPHLPDTYYGGAQDNGIYRGSDQDIDNWVRYSGGDGFQPAFHATNPEILFTESQNGNIRMSHPQGNPRLTSDMEGAFFWDTPYFLSTHNPNLLFTGSDRVYYVDIDEITGEYETIQLSDILTEPGSLWQSHSISTLHQSPINEDILYVGTTDGLIWRTIDFGNSWEQIGDGVPRRYVSRIHTSPSQENTVYLTLTGYRDNEYIPHVFRSDDNGDNWIDISSNLPQFAVNDVIVYPESNDEIIFVATDGGVFYTTDAGSSWELVGENMPIVPAWDLAHNIINNELVVGTYGKGILSFDLSQIGIGDGVATHDQQLAGFTVFPTISSDFVQIDFENDEVYGYKIYDQIGRQVKVESSLHHRSTIDVSNFNAGLYYLTLEQNGKRASTKFIVK